MPSTYSSRLRLELMATGENPGTWGTTTNTNLGTLLESSIAGRAAVSMTDADYTLTANNGSADEARNMILNISGTLTATRNVICPTVSKLYFVRNATTGGQSIVIKTASGSGITVPNGATAAVFCDGTNVVDAANQFRGVDGSSTAPSHSFSAEPTLGLYRASAGILAASGPLQLPANAASALHAVPLQQLTGYQPTFRNRLINGDFSVNQYAAPYYVSNIGANQAGFTVDRWFAQVAAGGSASGTSTYSQSLQAFALGQTAVTTDSANFLRTQVTAVGTFSGTQQAVRVQQSIESVRTLAGQTATVSFWAKADTARTMAFVFGQNYGTGGSPSTSTGIGQTFSVTTSWQKFTITLAIPSIFGKAVGTDGKDNLTCAFFLYKNDNSIYNDALGAVGSVVNGMYLDLADVQVEAGSVATQFERRPFGTERALCQRYYQIGQLGGYSTTTYVGGAWPLPVVMRSDTPGLTYFDTASNISRLSTTNGNNIAAINGAIYVSSSVVRVDFGMPASPGNWWLINYILFAEVY
jgi:hypothetical protein